MRYLVFIVLIFIGCKSKTTIPDNPATAYLNEVITIMEKNSVNRSSINWADFRAKVIKHAGSAVTVQDAYPSVHYAIKLLGDSHSYFAPANLIDAEEEKDPPVLKDEEFPANIGYIRLKYCMGNDASKQQYITETIAKIKQRDNINLHGWIVDLRGNFGGDMTPMLLAIAPVLGDGTAGYTLYPDNNETEWAIKEGHLTYNDYNNSEVIKSPETYTLAKQYTKVAVLTDTLTASSGEAITVAFKNRPKTKSFGWPTYGVSTSNEGFTLSDGSRMLLTVATFADRKKVKYGRKIQPDIICNPELAVNEAVKWLNRLEISPN